MKTMMKESDIRHDTHALVRWLILVASLIIAIVVVGGITRLTESGLSITRWQPVTGIIPPFSDAAWQAEFAHYRAIDQYGAVHAGMNLAQFQHIYFWEYTHRLIARAIGLIAAGGWLWFALGRKIPKAYGIRLLAVPLLVGMQGVLGWLMVASGLRPGMVEVAPAWLAAHLITALFTLSWTVWIALDLISFAENPQTKRARLTPLVALSGTVLAVQLVYGALMAGLRAGRVTNQWPLMNGRFFPEPTWSHQSAWHEITADPAIVHFLHRWWAWVVVVMLVTMARRLRKSDARRESILIHSAFGTQILLGIATVMSNVNLWFAALHQLIGALLVVCVVWGGHRLGERPCASVPRCFLPSC